MIRANVMEDREVNGDIMDVWSCKIMWSWRTFVGFIIEV